MSRLAVGIKPPGGFWEKPRNPIKQCGKIGGKHTVSIIKAQYNAMYLKHRKQLPLPGFLAKFEWVCLSSHQTSLALAFHSNLCVFQPQYLALSVPILRKTFAYVYHEP